MQLNQNSYINWERLSLFERYWFKDKGKTNISLTPNWVDFPNGSRENSNGEDRKWPISAENKLEWNSKKSASIQSINWSPFVWRKNICDGKWSSISLKLWLGNNYQVYIKAIYIYSLSWLLSHLTVKVNMITNYIGFANPVT